MRSIVKDNLIYIILLVVIAVLITVPHLAAYAYISNGNPNDTPSNEAITAYATNETFNYKDTNLNPRDQITPESDITYNVYPEHGLSMTVTPDAAVAPGDTVYHIYIVTNEGNADDDYTIRSHFTQEAGAKNWRVELWGYDALPPSGGSAVSTLTACTVDLQTVTVNDNSDKLFYYKVIVPTSVSDAPDGSRIMLTCTSETKLTPVGQYTGGNEFQYGGYADYRDYTTDEVSAPDIKMTRNAIIDAPTEGAYQGGDNDPVPGAVITYTITYSNEGSGTAYNCIIVDKIPTNSAWSTNLAHVNVGTGNNPTRDTVTISVARGTGLIWEVAYSTNSAPSKDYSNTSDWTHLVTIDAVTDYYPVGTDLITHGTTGFDAKWIRFRSLSNVAPNTLNQTIVWGVTIR